MIAIIQESFNALGEGRNLSEFFPDKPIDRVVLILALLGIAFAVRQYFDAREAKNKTLLVQDALKKQELQTSLVQEALTKAGIQALRLQDELNDLERKTSTHSLPRFPANVPAICKLLDDCPAGTTVEIMADYIGYSLYSEHDHFDAYLLSLQQAIRRGVKIRLLVYDYVQAKRAISKQFPNISWERDKPRFTQLFDRLKKPLANNENEFYRSLLIAEEGLYPKVKGIEMKLLSEEPPALFWLKDNPHSIVFGFRDEYPGIGFFFESQDRDLCDQFKIMFGTHWEHAEDHWDCRW